MWLQLAVNLTIDQGVQGGDQRKTLAGALRFRKPATFLMQKNTACPAVPGCGDRYPVDFAKRNFGRQHIAQSFRRSGVWQLENAQETQRVDPDAGVPLAAETAALATHLRIGMAACSGS
jgi:hypothetical protein